MSTQAQNTTATTQPAAVVATKPVENKDDNSSVISLAQFSASSAGLMTSEMLEVQTLYAYDMAKDFALNTNAFFAVNTEAATMLGDAAFHSCMDDANKSIVQGSTTIAGGAMSIGGAAWSANKSAEPAKLASEARTKATNMQEMKTQIANLQKAPASASGVQGAEENLSPNTKQLLSGDRTSLTAKDLNMEEIKGLSPAKRAEIEENLKEDIKHQETVAAGHQGEYQAISGKYQLFTQSAGQIIQGAGTAGSSYFDRDKAKWEKDRALLQPMSSQSSQMASSNQQKISELQGAAAEQLRNLRQVRDGAQNVRG